MATQKAINANAQKNNGGAVISAGSNLLTNPVLGARFNSSRSNSGVFGSTVVLGVNSSASLVSGEFAKVHQVIAPRITTTLAGTVSNTALLSGADFPRIARSINKLEVLRTYRSTTAIRAGNFNFYTGQFSVAPTVAVDSLNTDVAATPTKSVPGVLVFKSGSLVPVSANYKAKTT